MDIEIQSLNKHAQIYSQELEEMINEIHKAIIGQEEVVEKLILALVADGHVLLEGMPGLAKTLMIKTLSDTGNVSYEGEIKDISLKEEQTPLPYWLLIFLIMPLIGMYLYKKYWNNSRITTVESIPQVHIDPKEEALARLERAVEIFNKGMQREAYMEAFQCCKAVLLKERQELANLQAMRY